MVSPLATYYDTTKMRKILDSLIWIICVDYVASLYDLLGEVIQVLSEAAVCWSLFLLCGGSCGSEGVDNGSVLDSFPACEGWSCRLAQVISV